MTEPRRERYGTMKVVLSVGSVADLMFAWLGFARSSDARIEAWATVQQPLETPIATVTSTPVIVTPSASETPVAASTPTVEPSATPVEAPTTPPRARVSRGS